MNQLVIRLMFLLASSPVISAERLAYLEHVDGYWQVFVTENMGAQVKQITHSEYDKNAISWVASGTAIFVSGVQGEAELYSASTGMVTQFSLPHKHVNDAVMSPDMKQIAYSAIEVDRPDNKLWLYTPEAKHGLAVQHKLKGRQHDPQWRADGKGFYFVSGDAADYYDIRYTDIDIKQSKIIVANAAYNLDPSGAGNNKLLYSSNVSSGYDIWLQDNDFANRITSDAGAETQPAWSRSNNGVYYVKSDKAVTNIWFISLEENGVHKQITHSPVGARRPTVYSGAEE